MPMRRSAVLIVAVVLVLGLLGHLRMQHAAALHPDDAPVAAQGHHAEESGSRDPMGSSHEDCHLALRVEVARHGSPFDTLGGPAPIPTVQVETFSGTGHRPVLTAASAQPPRSPVADGVVLLT